MLTADREHGEGRRHESVSLCGLFVQGGAGFQGVAAKLLPWEFVVIREHACRSLDTPRVRCCVYQPVHPRLDTASICVIFFVSANLCTLVRKFTSIFLFYSQSRVAHAANRVVFVVPLYGGWMHGKAVEQEALGSMSESTCTYLELAHRLPSRLELEDP